MLLWLVLAVGISLVLFLTSERQVVVAGHDAVVRPTLSGKVVLHTGPVLPDVRIDSPSRVGVDVVLGKTELKSLDELFQRYAVLAAAPEGQQVQVESAVRSMAGAAVLRGAALSLLGVVAGVLLWRLPGPLRRADLWRRLGEVGRSRRSVVAVMVAVWTVVALTIALWQPWGGKPKLESDEAAGPVSGGWVSLSTFLGGEVPVPHELTGVQVRGDAYTAQTRKLVDSGVATYDASKRFYESVVAKVPTLTLRKPAADESVVAVIADRHDNIGMDSVARAIAHRGSATSVFDAGDDTSTGAVWETFSLDSVNAATKGFDRWAVTGNHDQGRTVGTYLDKHGWTVLDGKVVTGPGGALLLGAPDPRTSGFGGSNDKPRTIEQVGHSLANTACKAMADGKPVATLLVHDPSVGREALRRGCVTLVLGGHRHQHFGPTQVTGSNGHVGWTYTTGTTGGAAFSFAMGRINREAEVSFITYRDGLPVGTQWVDLETNGAFSTHAYVPLVAPVGVSPSGARPPSSAPVSPSR